MGAGVLLVARERGFPFQLLGAVGALLAWLFGMYLLHTQVGSSTLSYTAFLKLEFKNDASQIVDIIFAIAGGWVVPKE